MDDSTIDDFQNLSPGQDENQQQNSEIQTLPIFNPSFDQQRLSFYILTRRDRPIPSLESMKQFLDSSPEDSADARITELSEQCSEDLDRLYTAIAEDYIDEAEARFYSLNERFECPEDLKVSELSMLRPHLSDDNSEQALQLSLPSEDSNHQTEWDFMVDHTVATFHLQMEELQTRLDETSLSEAKELFIAQPFTFPQTIEEYRQKPQDMQACVARFLTLALDDDEQRESMMAEWDWDWTEVIKLKNEFLANSDFEEEIRRTIATPNDGTDESQ